MGAPRHSLLLAANGGQPLQSVAARRAGVAALDRLGYGALCTAAARQAGLDQYSQLDGAGPRFLQPVEKGGHPI
jgi:hypothetical protein